MLCQDAFQELALDMLRQRGKCVLVGKKIPNMLILKLIRAPIK